MTEAGWPSAVEEIDEAAFGEEIDFGGRPFILKFVDHGGGLRACRWTIFSSAGISISTLMKWPELQTMAPTLHMFEVLAADDALIAGHGDVNVALFNCFGHGPSRGKTVHRSFNALHRIDFGDDDIGAEALGAPMATPRPHQP